MTMNYLTYTPSTSNSDYALHFSCLAEFSRHLNSTPPKDWPAVALSYDTETQATSFVSCFDVVKEPYEVY